MSKPQQAALLSHFRGGQQDFEIVEFFLLSSAFAMASYVVLENSVANIVGGNSEWTFYLREGLL